MDKQPVLLLGHPTLMSKQPEVTIDEISAETFQQQLDNLCVQQIEHGGIGIAAPQIGWPVRILSLGINDTSRKRYPSAPVIPFNVWINPKILECSEKKCWAWEGCLSVPGMRGWVERPSKIIVSGLNRHGQPQRSEMSGFEARVMLHELDHLDGILFPMRIEDTSFIVPEQSMAWQTQWAEDWPTLHAKKTLNGNLSDYR